MANPNLEATVYYIDHPGLERYDSRLPADRLFDSEDAALAAAKAAYAETEAGKVIVAEYPSNRKVLTVSGSRTTPRVIRHRPYPTI